MGSSICKAPGIENMLENHIRDKALIIRQMKKNGQKSDQKESGKNDFGRAVNILSKIYEYDDIGQTEENNILYFGTSGEKSFGNIIGVLLCPDDSLKIMIKSSFQDLFSNTNDIRWPSIKVTNRHQSVSSCVAENFSRKLIGHTDFFIFYAVLEANLVGNTSIEKDVEKTVKYFEQWHAAPLQYIPKLFIFEFSEDNSTLPTLKFDKSEETVVILTNAKNYSKHMKNSLFTHLNRFNLGKVIKLSRFKAEAEGNTVLLI